MFIGIELNVTFMFQSDCDMNTEIKFIFHVEHENRQNA